MRIAFDLDDTLIPTTRSFAVGSEKLKFPFNLLFGEPLRVGAKELLKEISNDHELVIYTTSLRSPFYIRNWFRCWGVQINEIINYDKHLSVVSGTTFQMFSKAPVKFKIDLLIDDQPGVAEECKAQGCDSLIICPEDQNWTNSIRTKIANQRAALTVKTSVESGTAQATEGQVGSARLDQERRNHRPHPQ